jgi:hypothetical protein
MHKRLLFFVDEGGFDDFTPLFLSMGVEVNFEDSQRKAISAVFILCSSIGKENTVSIL